jgi:hypothetical protein
LDGNVAGHLLGEFILQIGELMAARGGHWQIYQSRSYPRRTYDASVLNYGQFISAIREASMSEFCRF